MFDTGDDLIFQKGVKEQHVRLRDIINVSYSHMTSPERVVVTSRTDGLIGKELVFSRLQRFSMFSKSPYVAGLIQRVDQARSA